ncbi:MAG: EAL domain-containing protein [Epsilonproteobacteria bacterium]|nr:EAL domain-containing protein [Campylobacterota bacterium]
MSLSSLLRYTKKLRLLYVEDNVEVRESTLLVLREFFEDILVASDGTQGLELFKTKGADLIITDINMPNMNGIDMAAEIRKIDPQIPIIIVSAYNEASYFMQSIKLDVEGYLLKPIELDQLISVFNKVVEKIKLKEEAKATLNLLHQYQEATDEIAVVSKMDTKGYLTYVNEEFCKLSGYSQNELIGKPYNLTHHPDTPKEVYAQIIKKIVKEKKSWKGILKNRSKWGDSFYLQTVIKPILGIDGSILEYISIGHDITEVMNPKKQLQDLISNSSQTLVILLKIENFEDIEHYYGTFIAQAIEEKFEKKVEQFANSLCRFERVYPLGEGEFALAKKLKECEEYKEVIENIKAKKKELQNLQVEISGFAYDVNTLISVAYGKDPLRNAKYGMKLLEKEGLDFILANNLTQKMQQVAKTNLKTLGIIKEAIEKDQVILYYQPIIDNLSQEIVKYETLLRIQTPSGEVLTPFLFLDVAKKSKYYSLLTSILFDKLFKILQSTSAHFTVNLSVLDIENEDTKELIYSYLKGYPQFSNRLTFELLEDEDSKNFKAIKEFIKEVKKMGVEIAIDDFGSGYSNFERLIEYAPDILKIDGTLIKEIDKNNFALDIVETINRFAKRQNIKTVAEFVENKKIFEIISSLGIDYSQGYYFAKPSPFLQKELQ